MTLFGWIVRYIRINAWRQIFPKSKENPLPVATHIVQKAWGDLLILSGGKKNTKIKSIGNNAFILLEGCCWNIYKPNSVPNEKVLKICRSISGGVAGQSSQLNTRVLTRTGSENPGLHRWRPLQTWEQLTAKCLLQNPFLDHVSWLQGHSLPEEINEKSASAVELCAVHCNTSPTAVVMEVLHSCSKLNRVL